MCVFKETRGKEQGSVLKLQESPSLQKKLTSLPYTVGPSDVKTLF